eukprot:1197722-Rhodomonas_salina.3
MSDCITGTDIDSISDVDQDDAAHAGRDCIVSLGQQSGPTSTECQTDLMWDHPCFSLLFFPISFLPMFELWFGFPRSECCHARIGVRVSVNVRALPAAQLQTVSRS